MTNSRTMQETSPEMKKNVYYQVKNEYFVILKMCITWELTGLDLTQVADFFLNTSLPDCTNK